MSDILPTYFISHGGGPWPWVPQMRQAHAELEASFQRMAAEIPPAPRAILMISGHWESADAYQVMTTARPPMIYDYFGFPEQTYQVSYPAPGAPGIAQEATRLIQDAGLPVATDNTRGFDHGCFVPMSVLFPNANVPVFQISMRSHYKPGEHMALGRALAPLRAQGVVIIGSGLSFHNLRILGPAARIPSAGFDAWLDQTLARNEAQRRTALLDWEKAPYARECHTQEDHLVPLFAVIGAAQQAKATRIYHETEAFGGVTASSYRFDG